jgi:hypothetical protein
MSIENQPGVTVEPTVTVSIAEPAPVMKGGLNVAEAPAGSPDALKLKVPA